MVKVQNINYIGKTYNKDIINAIRSAAVVYVSDVRDSFWNEKYVVVDGNGYRMHKTNFFDNVFPAILERATEKCHSCEIVTMSFPFFTSRMLKVELSV